MAILDHSVTLSSHFIYKQEQEPTPANKRFFRVMEPDFWDPKKSARVELSIGTHPTSLRRKMLRGYDGPCPKSPVMLGELASKAYSSVVANTTTGKMLKSLACAVVIGAVLGLGGAGVIGLASIVLGRLGLAMAWDSFVKLLCVAAVLGSAILGSFDVTDYKIAHARSQDMLALSDTWTKYDGKDIPFSLDHACRRIVKKAYDGTDWALREAAVEFEARQAARNITYTYAGQEAKY